MAKIDEKAHEKISAILADSRVSPSILAYNMLKESKYINETFIEYMMSYVYMMADTKLVPFQLAEIQQACQYLKSNFEELGLQDTIGRHVIEHEYIAI
jgi:hypothetical protein